MCIFLLNGKIGVLLILREFNSNKTAKDFDSKNRSSASFPMNDLVDDSLGMN